MKRITMFVGLSLTTGLVGQAATITFDGTSNSGYTYEYTLTLNNHNQHVFTNDSFTIYDFYDPQSFVTPNASWVVSTQLNAPGTPNDAAAKDVTFTYTGANITGPTVLDFSITSSSNIGRSDDSLLRFHKKQGQSTVADTVAGTVSVADVAPNIPLEDTTVPEPSSVLLAAAGVTLLSLKKLR